MNDGGGAGGVTGSFVVGSKLLLAPGVRIRRGMIMLDPGKVALVSAPA